MSKCECALDFLSILEGIEEIESLKNKARDEVTRELLIRTTKRIENRIKRTNKSCGIELQDHGFLEAIQYKFGEPDEVLRLVKKLKAEIISDFSIQCEE